MGFARLGLHLGATQAAHATGDSKGATGLGAGAQLKLHQLPYPPSRYTSNAAEGDRPTQRLQGGQPWGPIRPPHKKRSSPYPGTIATARGPSVWDLRAPRQKCVAGGACLAGAPTLPRRPGPKGEGQVPSPIPQPQPPPCGSGRCSTYPAVSRGMRARWAHPQPR